MTYLQFVQRLKDHPHLSECMVDPYDGRDCSDAVSLSLGDIQWGQGSYVECTPAFQVDFAGGSNYSGGTCERANYNVLADEYAGKVPGVITTYGGYDSFGILLLASRAMWRHPDTEELLERLDALRDWPLLDEDELTEVEQTIESESWDSWIATDFANGLPGNKADEIEDNILHGLFVTACDHASEYPIFEDPVSCYVDIGKLVKVVDRKQVADALRETRKKKLAETV